MGEFDYDLVFAGSGLAAGLAAYRVKQQHPSTRLLVLDAGRPDDWDQTWSFQTVPAPADERAREVLQSPDRSWLAPFLSGYWPRYQVHFPTRQRVLELPYASIRYRDFVRALREGLGSDYRQGVWIKKLEAQAITLEDGSIIRARCVIDARGWEGEADPATAGFQKFVGLHLQLKKPHGLAHPILMDARVPQIDGFRFMYVLPWTRDSLLIEDTHYSQSPSLDPKLYQDEILRYAQQQSWPIERVLGSEQGSLPIPYFGQRLPMQGRVPTIGVRAGLFHPTTGYSIYEAILFAEWLAQDALWRRSDFLELLQNHSQERWTQQEFYRRLNNMLFFASPEAERYQVLAKFYEHDEGLVARFYSGQTSARDKLMILSGKPPVPVRKGLYHFFHKAGVSRGTA